MSVWGLQFGGLPMEENQRLAKIIICVGNKLMCEGPLME
jgi:hypothetical protein